jgi:hypothetical protein
MFAEKHDFFMTTLLSSASRFRIPLLRALQVSYDDCFITNIHLDVGWSSHSANFHHLLFHFWNFEFTDL